MSLRLISVSGPRRQMTSFFFPLPRPRILCVLRVLCGSGIFLPPFHPEPLTEMHGRLFIAIAMLILALAPPSALAQGAKLVERPPDPHGSPRPFRDAKDVPVRTSLYLELAAPAGAKATEANPDSVSVSLR